jgi:WXG100 family type VII secretion target
MGQIVIAPEELKKAAADFLSARDDSQTILLRLEKTIARMEEGWQGVSQKTFFRDYREWKKCMEGISHLLKKVPLELDAMAMEYEREDS